MADRGFGGETTSVFGAKLGGPRRTKRSKGAIRKRSKVATGSASGTHGKSASAPGHIKKSLGLKSARSVAPGHTKRPLTPTSTPPSTSGNSMTGAKISAASPRRGLSTTDPSGGGSGKAAAIGATSRIRGNAAPSGGAMTGPIGAPRRSRSYGAMTGPARRRRG